MIGKTEVRDLATYNAESKLSSILSVMYNASILITIAGMYTSYCSLFQPYMSSCNEIWGNNYASNVKCLCIIQRKAVRLIYNADRLAHTNELFKELYILKFPEFVQYKTAILMLHLCHGTLHTLAKQIHCTFYYS